MALGRYRNGVRRLPDSDELECNTEVGSPVPLLVSGTKNGAGRSLSLATGDALCPISPARSPSPFGHSDDTASSRKSSDTSGTDDGEDDGEYELEAQDARKASMEDVKPEAPGRSRGYRVTRSMRQCAHLRPLTPRARPNSLITTNDTVRHFTRAHMKRLPTSTDTSALKTTRQGASSRIPPTKALQKPVLRAKKERYSDQDEYSVYADAGTPWGTAPPSPTLYDSDADDVLAPAWASPAGQRVPSNSPAPGTSCNLLMLSALAGFLLDFSKPAPSRKDAWNTACNGIKAKLPPVTGEAVVSRLNNDRECLTKVLALLPSRSPPLVTSALSRLVVS